ncbi:MAG: HAMP domain-containing sensor histidine kinase [Patescibacteria group bacterium]
MKTLRTTRLATPPSLNAVRASADLAHSIQTPLAILKSELFFLRQEIPENSRARVCDKLIDDIATSLRGFLDLSRLDQSLQTKTFQYFSLSELCEDTLESLETLAEANGVHLQFRITPDLSMHGLPEKIRDLLIQLVGNSISYIGHGKKEMYVILSRRHSAGTLTIEDTGIGIPKKDLMHICEPFYRGKNVIERGMAGTGLGLSTAKRIVDIHRGKMSIESVVGKGTRVTLRIPLA